MRSVLPIVVALVSIGCGPKAQQYETDLEIVRIEVVRRDDKGTPLTVDVEMSFEQCPGEQRTTARGDKAFAACIAKLKVGDVVKGKISHEKNEFGDFVPRIVGLGDCARVLDPNDEASFEIVQVCSDLVVNGVKVGFRCDRRASKELIDKCPWFRRR